MARSGAGFAGSGRQWSVYAFPTAMLVTADGKVRAVVQGEVDWTGQPASRLLQALF